MVKAPQKCSRFDCTTTGNGKYAIYVDGKLVVDGVDNGTVAVTDTNQMLFE